MDTAFAMRHQQGLTPWSSTIFEVLMTDQGKNLEEYGKLVKSYLKKAVDKAGEIKDSALHHAKETLDTARAIWALKGKINKKFKIEVRKLSSIALDPDEVLLIELGDKNGKWNPTQKDMQEFRDLLQVVFEGKGIECMIVPTGTVKVKKIKKSKGR